MMCRVFQSCGARSTGRLKIILNTTMGLIGCAGFFRGVYKWAAATSVAPSDLSTVLFVSVGLVLGTTAALNAAAWRYAAANPAPEASPFSMETWDAYVGGPGPAQSLHKGTQIDLTI